jgi:hypothetical protein
VSSTTVRNDPFARSSIAAKTAVEPSSDRRSLGLAGANVEVSRRARPSSRAAVFVRDGGERGCQPGLADPRDARDDDAAGIALASAAPVPAEPGELPLTAGERYDRVELWRDRSRARRGDGWAAGAGNDRVRGHGHDADVQWQVRTVV